MTVPKPLRHVLPALLAIAAYSVAAYSVASPADGDVTLVKVNYDDVLAKIAANKGAKITVMDAWATWCVPCMENFPHLVEMHKKYADKGLAVVSLSLDDPDQPKKIAAAEAFLKEKGATFPNYYLAEAAEAAFEKLNIGVIPAVFLYGPDGKEIKRFTLEDADHPFTYDQVEAAIKEKLGVK
jgi:thiol-disulfide isomerase/thioredoxin